MYGPAEIAKRYSDAGAGKTKLAIPKMFILAIFAGIFIAFGAFGSQVAGADAGAAASVGKLMSALVFPVGLLLVIMAGAELFTGNNLIIISVLNKKATVSGMLRNWGVVYLGNFLGSIFVAAMLTYSHAYSLYDGKLAQSAVATATAKVSLSLPDAFLKGILCNMLVCLAVWISFSAEDVAGKILGLYLPIMLFVLSGYEHCVANMYFVPAGMFISGEYGIPAESVTWLSFLLNNLLPVTLGNIVGGACIIGLGYFFAYLYGVKTPKSRNGAGLDKKQLVDMSGSQEVVGVSAMAEPAAAPLTEPLGYVPEAGGAQRSLEVVLNGATICVPNDADPTMLAQTIHLIKNLP